MSISHHCCFHSQKTSHNMNNVGGKIWGGGQSSQALVLGERPEAPAMGMRLEKTKTNQIILHWENVSGCPSADADFLVTREGHRWGDSQIQHLGF